jgi:hypothetical protein
MAISIQQIINTSRTYDEATRSFNSNYPNPTTSEGNEFLSKVNSKFPSNTSNTSTSNTNNPKDESKVGKVIGGFTKLLVDVAATQEASSGYITDSYVEFNEALGGLIDSQGNLNSIEEIGKKARESMYSGFLNYLKQQTELLHQVNEGTSLTGKLSEGVREELTEASVPLMKYKIGFQEIVTASLDLTKSTSKFNLINSETWDKVAQSALAYVGTLSSLTEMLPAFANIGYGASDSAKQIQISGQRIMKLGLDSKSMLKEVGQNLNKINEYAFKDGVQGLSNMITKAKEFRMEMQSTFTIAEKVMDPEGAIDMAANLMAIGGAIGDLGDPMKMMYMATNNVEGIQDALIGATSSLATFNKESGKFEVIGINIRKAKAMADAMGISMSEMRKGAIAAAERTSAAMDMLSNGLKLDKDQTDLITNLAHMKDGKMVMEVQGDKMREMLGLKKDVKEIALEELTQSQAESLAEYQKRESEKTPEQIIRGQATNIELMTRDINYIFRLLTVEAGKTGKQLMESLGVSTKFNDLANKTQELSKVVAPETVKVNQEVRKVIKTNLNVTPDAADIPGADNSKKEDKTTTSVDGSLGYSNIKISLESNVNEDRWRTDLLNHPTFTKDVVNSIDKRDYTNVGFG